MAPIGGVANCERRVPKSIPSAHSSKEHPGGHQPVGPSAVNFVQDINLVERFSGGDGHIDIGSVRPSPFNEPPSTRSRR